MKKNIVGMHENSCPMCNGNIAFIKIKGKVFSNCRACGALTEGRIKNKLQVYTYDFKEGK